MMRIALLLIAALLLLPACTTARVTVEAADASGRGLISAPFRIRAGKPPGELGLETVEDRTDARGVAVVEIPFKSLPTAVFIDIRGDEGVWWSGSAAVTQLPTSIDEIYMTQSLEDRDDTFGGFASGFSSRPPSVRLTINPN